MGKKLLKPEDILYPEQAKVLYNLRKENNFLQQEVANKIGVSLRTYTPWERGVKRIESNALIALSKLYGVSCDHLLCVIKEKNHDLHFIHEETGLSEKAIMKLKENKDAIMFHDDSDKQESFSEVVSAIIEHDRFRSFVFRLLQSKALRTTITKHHKLEKKEIEAAYATLTVMGYAILAPGQNNTISIYDAKQEIAGIIDDLFRNKETGFIELRK